MKQILRYSLVALLAMVFGNVMADEAILKYSGTTTANMKADGSNEAASVGLDESVWYVVADKGAASNAPGLNKAGDIRLYWHADGGNTITVSSLTNATISSIAITFTGADYSNVSVTVDGNAVTGTDGVYNINSTSFVLGNANTASAQVRISQIVITYSGGTPVSVLAPKFSVASGSFFEPVTVALSCDTEGAKILYTMTGQDPEYTDDNNYSGIFYDGNPLTITQTTTIKAMAVKGGETSSIVEATYTIVELEETSVASALEVINGLGDGATSADVYKVKGFVIEVTEISTQHGNATFVIADSKDAETGLTVFRVKGLHNENITDEEIIKVGDQVVVLGKLKKYVKDEVVTPEIVSGYLFSITPAPKDVLLVLGEGCDISAALEAELGGAKAKSIEIILSDAAFTITTPITCAGNIDFSGNNTTIDASALEGPFIKLEGSEEFAMKDETTASDHYLINKVVVEGVIINGLKDAFIKDNQKTLLENLKVTNCKIEMPAAGKNFIDFNGKGYVGLVKVDASTIWANGMNTGFFAQYGSRPKNINGEWLQEFNVQNSTIVNIANGKNICDLKQNGTAQNVYILKNNIFVDFGKSGQTVVGFNKGQTSATPVWDVTGNYFEAGGECKNDAEIEKAGQKDEEDIVKASVAGTIAFTDAANGDFNGTFTLAAGATQPEVLGDPRWTITFAEPVTWTVAGTAPLVDKTWDPSDTNADMTTTDGVNFTYVKEDITLEAGVSYQFKVVKNHAWGEEYPSSNYVVTVNETAKYKVTITFNADSKEISCETVKTGEAGPVTHTWSVVGTLVGSWDDDVDMTKGDDGLYKLVVENVAKGDYAFKVRADHAWNIAYPAQDYELNVTQDGSTVTVTFNEETEEVNATISAPTGITTAKVVELSGAAYNLAGQKVDKNFKGIVIVNGKKMMQSN